jgi:hypothetical protein
LEHNFNFGYPHARQPALLVILFVSSILGSAGVFGAPLPTIAGDRRIVVPSLGCAPGGTGRRLGGGPWPSAITPGLTYDANPSLPEIKNWSHRYSSKAGLPWVPPHERPHLVAAAVGGIPGLDSWPVGRPPATVIGLRRYLRRHHHRTKLWILVVMALFAFLMLAILMFAAGCILALAEPSTGGQLIRVTDIARAYIISGVATLIWLSGAGLIGISLSLAVNLWIRMGLAAFGAGMVMAGLTWSSLAPIADRVLKSAGELVSQVTALSERVRQTPPREM